MREARGGPGSPTAWTGWPSSSPARHTPRALPRRSFARLGNENANSKEAIMRIGSVILVIWLILGFFAAGQRGYYTKTPSCGNAGTIIVTILAGPLNYLGVNPKVACQ